MADTWTRTVTVGLTRVKEPEVDDWISLGLDEKLVAFLLSRPGFVLSDFIENFQNFFFFFNQLFVARGSDDNEPQTACFKHCSVGERRGCICSGECDGGRRQFSSHSGFRTPHMWLISLLLGSRAAVLCAVILLHAADAASASGLLRLEGQARLRLSRTILSDLEDSKTTRP